MMTFGYRNTIGLVLVSMVAITSLESVTSFVMGGGGLHNCPRTKRSDLASTQQTKETLSHISGVSEAADSYSTFLLDMWGVMHDGSQPYPGVLETVQKLKESGKKLIILSNSSKRTSNSIKMLNKLGFNPDDFEQIITSGEVSYRMLAGDKSLGCSTWEILTDLIESNKKKVFVFGSGDGDEEYCTSSGWELAPIEDCDLILARGTFTINDGTTVTFKKESEENYFQVLEESLRIAALKKIPMLVSNPDKVRPDKGLPPMPGAIGDSYEKSMGGGMEATSLVKRIGKPYPEVYELALGEVTSTDDAVMVGDALETDVTGGTNFGCDTMWVIKDGIHGPTIAQKEEEEESSFEQGVLSVLDTFNENRGTTLSPTFIVPHMRW